MKFLSTSGYCLLIFFCLPFFKLTGQSCGPDMDVRLRCDTSAEIISSVALPLAQPDQSATWLQLLPYHGQEVSLRGEFWYARCSMATDLCLLHANGLFHQGKWIQFDGLVLEHSIVKRHIDKREHFMRGTLEIKTWGDHAEVFLHGVGHWFEIQDETQPPVETDCIETPEDYDCIIEFDCIEEPTLEDVQLTWDELKVDYVKFDGEMLGSSVLHPVHSEGQMFLDGRICRISGYLVNLGYEKDYWVIARHPDALSCFGPSITPDQAIEVNLPVGVSFESGTPVQAVGWLVVNENEPGKMHYGFEHVSLEEDHSAVEPRQKVCTKGPTGKQMKKPSRLRTY